MDGFPTFPVEVARLILLEAVQTRGLKRAVRLRFVNRWWNVEVIEAILRWGVLDSCNDLFRSPFFPQYLPYKIFSNETPRFRNLCVIREVAKRVLMFRGEDASDDAVKRCISQFATNWGGVGSGYCYWNDGFSSYVGERVEEDIVIYDNDEDFQRALLTAAIITDDITLVKHQLSHMRDSPHLLSDRRCISVTEIDPTVLGYPTDIAASLGNTEVLTLLFEFITDRSELSDAREQGAGCSANNFATFKLCQDPEPATYYSRDSISIIESTLSPEIFEYMEIVCGALIHVPGTRVRKNILMLRLENCFQNAVQYGSLDMMKYLVRRGVVIKDFRINEEFRWPTDDYEPTQNDHRDGFSALTSYAALGGYTVVLQYLIENGAKIGCRSLEAACKHGNPECVKLLLEHSATDHFNPGSALLRCLERENETVVQQLMAAGIAFGIGMNDDVKKQMLDVIEKEGLESMSKILQKCN